MNNFIDMTNWIMSEHGIPDSKWTVVKYEKSGKWLCQCQCGKQKVVNGASLRRGTSKSCGKCRDTAPNLKNEIGNRYGRLVVIK